ncbi:hypothetical protein CJF32_00007837 [Rutstroemia sp. NJR-2017a WRK4]|nr:hypothetical protein CJF32_00007837 [Rutstroemia sp. NJR-2017a WRK4]
MSAQAAGRAAAQAAKSAAKSADGHVLNKGAKRDPELYVLMGVMAGAFGLAGWYFGKVIPQFKLLEELELTPTSATSEARVNVAPGSMPWQTTSTEGDAARQDFKYQYHPAGDPRNPPKDAPSALHSVIVPNVNLPKVCGIIEVVALKMRNKDKIMSLWDPGIVQSSTDAYSLRNYTRSTTNGARMVTRKEDLSAGPWDY